jgi:hypothetical protein
MPCANRRPRAIAVIAFALAVGVYQGGASESTYGRAIFNRSGEVDSAKPIGLAINEWRKFTSLFGGKNINDAIAKIVKARGEFDVTVQ